MTPIDCYRVHLRLCGRMTQLPDSQKLFGALIYLLAEQHSPEWVTGLAGSIQEGKRYLSLSNLLPEDCLPVPQTRLLDQLEEWEGDKKPIYQQIKERQFLKRKLLARLLSKPSLAKDIFPYVRIKESQQIHAAIDSLRLQMPGLDPNLYSVPEAEVVEITRTDSTTSLHSFEFYLGMDSGEEAPIILSALTKAMETGRPFFLGPRFSQGLNTYFITDIEKLPMAYEAPSESYLNTGMLLPDQIDFKHSALRLFTSERRPFQRPEGWAQDADARFLSFIEAGSEIVIRAGVRRAGKSIPSPFEQKAVVFGNAFLYPMDALKGEGHT